MRSVDSLTNGPHLTRGAGPGDAFESEAAAMEGVRQLVGLYRDACLWFLAPDFMPADREQALRALSYIERYGNRDAFVRAGELRRWFSRTSSESSAG
ncbi:MAG: hypothetical protein HYY25_15100 [Candidatus Wallbacteria bacterium]|nr:hypothetical protein [Candidatus Wallbacteria bacterium]